MLTTFKNHSSFTDIIKPEVTAYMRDNWAEWVRTSPPWFTPKFISSVGDEFIPDADLLQLNAGGTRQRRRSSINLQSMRELLSNDDEVN